MRGKWLVIIFSVTPIPAMRCASSTNPDGLSAGWAIRSATQPTGLRIAFRYLAGYLHQGMQGIFYGLYIINNTTKIQKINEIGYSYIAKYHTFI